MRAVRSGQFWGGVLVGALLVTFVPALNFRGKVRTGA